MVAVNSWENDKRLESETKWKRLVSSQTFRQRYFKVVEKKKYLFWKAPQANLNSNPKLNPRIRVGVNSQGNDKCLEPESKCKTLVSSQTFREKYLKLVQTKKYLFWKSPQANPNPNPKLNPGLGLGLTSGKTISVQNLKPSAKDQYRRRRSGIDVLNLCRR